jgi:peptide/nickel transport system permease protein
LASVSYLVRRLEFFVITLWAALTINFLLPRFMPGNPGQAMLVRFHGRASPQTIKTLEVAFGLHSDENIVQQYLGYLGNTLRGEFGTSLTFFPLSVAKVIMLALPWTVALVGIATIIAFVLGTLIGMLSAWHRGGILDALLPPTFIVVSAFPYFWIGLLLTLLFALTLNWFPIGFGYPIDSQINLSWSFVGDVIWHGFLPALTIVITSIGGWILTMRNTMITTLAEDYVKMARAKGLSPVRIMLMYAGRNAILPNLTGFAMSLGFVISGAILVEIVFNYPGLGFMLLQAVNNEDFALMQALFLLITVAVLAAVLIADVLTAWLDPRTRESG